MQELLRVVTDSDANDLLGLTAALCAVPSVFPNEGPLADAIEARLRIRAPRLVTTRFGNNVIARTNVGSARRIVLGGHLDTVPANNNQVPHVHGDVLHALGAADMKGSLAVMLRLAEQASLREPAYDITFVFYEGEEVAEEHNGLRAVFAAAPELLACDLAVLCEPTGGWVEAGCQGTLHMRAEFTGTRAHSARPWMGVNAIARCAPIHAKVAEHTPEVVNIDGLEFTQALQLVRVEGGVSNNVVPDAAAFVVNRRFAPSFSAQEIIAEMRAFLDGADQTVVINESEGALPNLADPTVAEFVATLGLSVRAKL